jgi:hypothetical protein
MRCPKIRIPWRNLHPAIVGTTGLLIMMILGLVWTRGQRVLGNDSFGYLELAKHFRQVRPDHLGDWWPFGFPVAGSLICKTGLSTYASLFAVSTIGFLAIISCLWWLLPSEVKSSRLTITIILAAVCAPVCPLLLTGTMSEPLFAAILFGIVLSLSRWPSRTAVLASLFFCLLAFCVRYAGAFTFVMVGFYALLSWSRLVAKRRGGLFLVAYVLALIALAVLCYSNYRHFGRVTGPQPVGHENFFSWPSHLASFGWSPVAAFSSSKVLEGLGGISNPICFCGGWLLTLGGSYFLFRTWKTPSSPASRPMVLLIICYSLAVVTLRSTTPFDAVSSARTFLPILFPWAYLIVTETPAGLVRPMSTGAIALIGAGVTLASRGISKEVRPDISQARKALETIVQPGQSVAVNGTAMSVAAYFENHFLSIGESQDGLTPGWEPTEGWNPHRTNLILYVFSSRPKSRDASEDKKRIWEELSRMAIDSGAARELAREGTFVLLESVEKRPGIQACAD